MVFQYDGTFAGLLTAIFDSYDLKLKPAAIQKEHAYVKNMFDQYHTVITDQAKVGRVLTGLKKKLSSYAISCLYKALHSEQEQIEIVILNYIRLVLSSDGNIEKDYRQAPVLRIRQVVRMVDREIHRMFGFVRFQRTADDIYAATIIPDFDVIPFIGEHFKRRYANQCWIIYDTRRDYGLFYDMKEMQEIHLEGATWAGRKKINPLVLSEDEYSFPDMWRNYFLSTSTSERKNAKLHLKHLPHRYWRYLPEKYVSSAGNQGKRI